MSDTKKTKAQLLDELAILRRKITELEKPQASEKRQVEEERRNRQAAEELARETAAVAEIGRIISSTMNIEEVYERFAAEVKKIVPFDRIVINIVDLEAETTTNVYIAGDEVTDRKVGLTYTLKGSSTKEMLYTKTSTLIQTDDFTAYKDRYPGLVSTFQAGFRSILNVPLISKGAVIGGLLLRSRNNNAYTDSDVRLAERVGNQIAGAIANARLFSELKVTQETIKKSEERYRAIFEQAAIGVAEIEMETGRFLAVNQRLCKMLGRTKEELLATHFLAITHPDDLDLHVEKTALMADEKINEFNVVKRYIRKDGEVVWVNITRSAFGKPGEALTRNLVVVQDITERRRTEEELQMAHAKMALLINSISSILIAVSEDNRIVFWNLEAERQFGISEIKVIGKPIDALGIQWDLDQVMNGINRCRTEQTSVALESVRFVQRNGVEGILGIGISPSFDEQSFGMLTLLQASNVTQRRLLESQLRQAQKMESIGQLAAGIAHEINTPTQYVGDNVRFLQAACKTVKGVLSKYAALTERIREGKACDDLLGEVDRSVQEADMEYLHEELPKAFEQTLEGVHRVSKIVQSMKAFAHPGTADKVPVDINRAIETTILVSRNEWKYVADLQTDLAPSLPLIPGVPGDINQVILNVLVNAAQAISEVVEGGSLGKGKIWISTRQDDSWVEIRIRDTGKGIPVEIRPRIFDPFFTTKEVGKGSGQGLAISYRAIVERHHGTITFETEIDQGTTFIIHLPVKEPTHASQKA